MYAVATNVRSIPSYTRQTGFAIPMEKDLFITVSFVRAGTVGTSCRASRGARLQKQGTRPEVHLCCSGFTFPALGVAHREAKSFCLSAYFSVCKKPRIMLPASQKRNNLKPSMKGAIEAQAAIVKPAPTIPRGMRAFHVCSGAAGNNALSGQ